MSELPPPDAWEEQPESGWYPDPEGPGERWWSGERWTDNRRMPAQRTGPTFGGVFKGTLYVFLSIALLVVLGFVGCSALLMSAGS